MSNIIVHDAGRAIEAARQMYAIVANMSKDVLREGVDYGTIPGTNKPTLLKPGAEKLCWALGLRPEFKAVSITEDFDKPLFYYRYECNLIHIESGAIVGSGIGSCNSYEDKYGWRWVDESEAPDDHNYMTRTSSVSEFEFAINKAETTGKYGKPAEYWQAFKDAIDSGKAQKTMRTTRNGESVAYVIEAKQVRVPNENIYSIVNTLDKMAQKRALIASVLIAAGASEFFTQDVEDMPGFAEIEAPVITVTKNDTPTQNDKPEQDKKDTKKKTKRKDVDQNTGEIERPKTMRELAWDTFTEQYGKEYKGDYATFEPHLVAMHSDGKLDGLTTPEAIVNALVKEMKDNADFWLPELS